MPPKEKVESTEQILQAVILADSFDERFQPITLETARCLLPLCNVPLISYTFEFLAVAGVQEIFVFCCSHSDKVKAFVNAVGDGSLFVLDQSSKECLHYQPVKAYKSTRQDRRMTMDMEIFDKHPEVQIRSDLIDCQVDICSVEVPALFTENFDYQDIRADFVHGILTSDLLGKTIHFHEVSDVYAARVRSTQMYDAISKDIISRWTFPMVPDSNLQADDCYEYRRGLVYKEKSVVLSRTSVVEEKVVIGANTQIAEMSVLSNCVIGKNCVIGANVKIDNAYIWDNVTIMDNCVVQQSIIANNAVLEQGVTISKGCLISFNVTVGANTTVPPYSRLTTLPEVEDDSDAELISEPAVVGTTGRGRTFKEAEDSDDDDDEVDPKNKQVNLLAYDMTALILENQAQEEASASEFESEASDLEEEEVNPAEELDREIAQTLERAFRDGHTVDIAALELNTLRMASNSNFHEMRKRIIPGVLQNIELGANPGSGKTAKEILVRWGPLIGRMIHDDADQVDGLFILQRACAALQADKVFGPALRYFYDEDILEEDAILSWYYDERSQQGTDVEKRLRELTTPMIQFLEQSEDEDSDEDEEDEDSD
ncbi:hypothetical protein BGX28_002567 [Mortierella sp. GBA30]|nr:hypothetical protein BGX28_002567 [Mortierella sp. GBA30]